MQLKKIFTKQLMELAARLWAALYLILYGIFKFNQFTGYKEIDVPISQSTGDEIMWAFFGTTQSYPIIIGILQIIGALLLIFRKTKLIGAIFSTPILLNIILLDILYQIDLGALLCALLIQLVCLYIMFIEYDKIKKSFNLLFIRDTENNESFNLKFNKFVVAAMLAFALYIVFQKILSYIPI